MYYLIVSSILDNDSGYEFKFNNLKTLLSTIKELFKMDKDLSFEIYYED